MKRKFTALPSSYVHSNTFGKNLDSSKLKLPYPLNKYYDVCTIHDMLELGFDNEDYMVPMPAYKNYPEFELVGYAKAKPKYEDILDDVAYADIVRDVNTGEIKLTYSYGQHSVNNISIDEVESRVEAWKEDYFENVILEGNEDEDEYERKFEAFWKTY